MKHLIYLLFLITVVSCNTDNEKYYVQKVSFDKNLPLAEKVKIAAHVVPSQKQYDWQELEMTAFVHFTVNTFTDMEWGHGDELPEIFNPVDLDAEQWVKTLKDAGMKLVILTCKHHDGFCLWPTKTTKHSVASSSWKNGKGDVVREVKDACEKYGMKFGIYLSPWDRNTVCYGDSPAYDKYFMEQLTELLTNYGKVDEVWFDGANGEGPNGKKQIYNWDAYYDLINKLQPEAVVAIVGEDIRWVGTESGYARETEWSVVALHPGGRSEKTEINKELKLRATSKDLGSRKVIEKADHLFWYPAEVDVSIRPGWFYHKNQDTHVKSLEKLVDIYFSSVGRNSVLLLNVPPDKRGLIHETDAKRLKEFGDYIRNTFRTDLTKGAKPSERAARKMIDVDKDTYWHVKELPSSVEFRLDGKKRFNVVMLQEEIRKGQRVEKFKVEAMVDGQWKEIISGTTIGYKRLLRFDRVTTDRVRLTILVARDGALISRFGLFERADILNDPTITRNKQGEVSIGVPGAHSESVIKYTTDGTDPDRNSATYSQVFKMPGKGVVKARAYVNDMKDSSAVIVEKFDICPEKWKVVAFDTEAEAYPAANAVDGDVRSMWHTPWSGDVKGHPHYIVVDMGEVLKIKGFTYTPRISSNKGGTVSRYRFYVSKDGRNWIKVPVKGEFSNIKNNPIKQEVMFGRTYPARYFKFVTLSDINNEKWASVAEIGVITE